jgi:hypothetical protein
MTIMKRVHSSKWLAAVSSFFSIFPNIYNQLRAQ